MPPYITPAAAASTLRRGITAGLPSYSWGSFPLGQQPAKLFVSGVVSAAGTATLNVTIQAGNIPAVGATVIVAGTAAGGGALNGTQTLTAIALNAQGVGTLAFASGATIPQQNDGGTVTQVLSDVGEVTSVAKGLQFAIDPAGGYGFTFVWACTAATVALQLEGAVDDVDAQYAIIGTSQTTLTGSVVAQVPNNVRFLRVNTTAFTGGPGTIWAKIYQSTSTGM